VTVLPPNADSQPPLVTLFTLNEGAPLTGQPQITATVLANDPGALATGVAYIFLLEYRWDHTRRGWLPLLDRGVWLPYEEAAGRAATYPWQLSAAPGLAYFQVWAADRAGNTSAAPQRAAINYIPPLLHLASGETLLYRFHLEAGDQLTVAAEPTEGDPDLYLWAPDYQTRSPWVSNEGSARVDRLSVTAPVSGRYQLEIDGYSATTFALTIEIEAATAWGVEQVISASQTAKPRRTAPGVPPEAAPADQYALQPPEAAASYLLRLPMVLR
jgi:hypothetical protein